MQRNANCWTPEPCEETATVLLGGEVGVNAVMAPAGVTETVQVVGVVLPAIQTTETASNMVDDEVNALPIGRTPFALAAIQPGLNTNTPNAGQLAINGSFAYDNVYLVDGVDTNDNLFGTSNALYVADAVASKLCGQIRKIRATYVHHEAERVLHKRAAGTRRVKVQMWRFSKVPLGPG